jgi:17beta-estradiol 17-dehydrogenase / very-long-chain 3-oxoacyl-CoA reductase
MASMTASLLPLMNSRKKKSAIINLSSFMGEGVIPYSTLYSATKAFNLLFSDGISMEYPNIDVLGLKPMFV